MTFQMMLESYFLGQQVCESVFCLRRLLQYAAWIWQKAQSERKKKDRRGRDKEEDEIEGWEGELP